MENLRKLAIIIVIGCCLVFSTKASAQAMVTRGQHVVLKWFGGVEVVSQSNTQVETPKGRLNFRVIFQLPEGAPGVEKKAYSLPLFWISDFGVFRGEGIVTPDHKLVDKPWVQVLVLSYVG